MKNFNFPNNYIQIQMLYSWISIEKFYLPEFLLSNLHCNWFSIGAKISLEMCWGIPQSEFIIWVEWYTEEWRRAYWDIRTRLYQPFCKRSTGLWVTETWVHRCVPSHSFQTQVHSIRISPSQKYTQNSQKRIIYL